LEDSKLSWFIQDTDISSKGSQRCLTPPFTCPQSVYSDLFPTQ